MTYTPPTPDELRIMQASEQLTHLSAIDAAILTAKKELDGLAALESIARAGKEDAEKGWIEAKRGVREAHDAYEQQRRYISALSHLSRHIKTLLRHQ